MKEKKYCFLADEIIVQSWSSAPSNEFSPESSTGIKVTHKRTKLIATCDDFRSQHENRHKAFLILERLLQE